MKQHKNWTRKSIFFFFIDNCPKKILVLSSYLIWIGTQHDSHHIPPDYSSKMTDLKSVHNKPYITTAAVTTKLTAKYE